MVCVGGKFYSGNFVLSEGETEQKTKDGRTYRQSHVDVEIDGQHIARERYARLSTTFVQIIPCHHDLRTWRADGDGRVATTDSNAIIVAFALCADGAVRALMDGEGSIEAAESAVNYVGFAPPGVAPSGWVLTGTDRAKKAGGPPPLAEDEIAPGVIDQNNK